MRTNFGFKGLLTTIKFFKEFKDEWEVCKIFLAIRLGSRQSDRLSHVVLTRVGLDGNVVSVRVVMRQNENILTFSCRLNFDSEIYRYRRRLSEFRRLLKTFLLR